MSDTIYREDAKRQAVNGADAWDGGCNPSRDEYICNAIDEIPSADRWIPCEERMPMYDVDVLVYRPTMGQKIIVDTYCGFYGEDIDDLDEWYEGWGISREHAVTAWMPLPEPWKGAEDE